HRAGQRVTISGSREPIYAFRQEPKPEINRYLFMYCLDRYWAEHHSAEKTLSLQQIANNPGSPGTVFRLPEADLRDRLERIASDSDGFFTYVESANLQQVRRLDDKAPDFLSLAYKEQPSNG